MFPLLLAATFVASLLVCAVTIALFWPPITAVLRRRLSPRATALWSRLLLFGVFVTGVSMGARIWDLERYMGLAQPITLNVVALEVYKTIIATGQANIAVVLLVCVGIGVLAMMKRPEAHKEPL